MVHSEIQEPGLDLIHQGLFSYFIMVSTPFQFRGRVLVTPKLATFQSENLINGSCALFLDSIFPLRTPNPVPSLSNR